MRRTLLGFVLLTIAVVLTGCGDDGDTRVTHNNADVKFAQQMVPYHEQAVEMAALAATRTDNDAVLELAGRIERAQGPEIEQLEAWLTKWGAEPADEAHSGHTEMSGMAAMPGRMPAKDMRELAESTGADFDSAWLELMIEHHEGAVAMARTELSRGSDPEAMAMALAQRIVDARLAEISEMRDQSSTP